MNKNPMVSIIIPCKEIEKPKYSFVQKASDCILSLFIVGGLSNKYERFRIVI
jgi:glycosyltransferase involved in cell wall biosynthesis